MSTYDPASIYTRAPVTAEGMAGLFENLGVLLATANADAIAGRPRHSVTANAAHALNVALEVHPSNPPEALANAMRNYIGEWVRTELRKVLWASGEPGEPEL